MSSIRTRGAHPRGGGEHISSRPSRRCCGFWLIPAEAGSTRRARHSSRTGWAHPRGGGEHQSACRERAGAGGSSPRRRGALPAVHFASCAAGSSPRRRGAPSEDARPGRVSGLIPAEAGSTSRNGIEAGVAGAHPRGGGEHNRSEIADIAEIGSSPRRRGARGAPVSRGASPGLIPAEAGSTDHVIRELTRCGAHPRGGGEHTPRPFAREVELGSSPRRRGAPRPASTWRRASGLIPAEAGSTRATTARSARRTAHPRGGGEHVVTRRGALPGRGSSPRRRGARRHRSDHGRTGGLIPAEAGSTLQASSDTRSAGAHPRGGGEHRVAVDRFPEGLGSSPRRRGAPERREAVRALHGLIPAEAGSTRPRHDVPGARRGLIPAEAGSTVRRPRSRMTPTAHPRGGGEHVECRRAKAEYEGSSPRRRGARSLTCAGRCGRGLIPAEAGSTDSAPTAAPSDRAHPRGGGEHRSANPADPQHEGSSPRRRGAPVAPLELPQTPGLIPAEAGSTRGRAT